MVALPGTLGAWAVARAASTTASALLSCVAYLGALPLPALLLAVALTGLGTPCSPWAAVDLVPVILLPTVALCAAAAVALARGLSRWWWAALAWLGCVLASALHTVWPVLTGPQVYAFNHLAGFVPGPLYDELILVTPALLWFRAGTCLLAAALALALLGRPALALACALGLLLLEANGPALGFRMTHAALQQALGAREEGPGFVVYLPEEYTALERARVRADLSFRVHQVRDFLALPPGDPPVQVYWHRSEEEKKRLVGAGRTQFAVPWRGELHVNAAGFPHPVVKHELAHALAAPYGAWPFGVTATWGGLWPSMGLVEGLAVAADDPVDELRLTGWAAAMKRQGLLPDVAGLLSASGFYGAPASRAYTAAGAFLRWLADTRGADTLRALYRRGDFEGTYGQTAQALRQEWEAFLDGVELTAAEEAQAAARFRGGSVFQRPCAREVARLQHALARALPEEQLRLYRACQRLQPREPAHVLAQAEVLAGRERWLDVDATLSPLLPALAGEDVLHGQASLALAEARLKLGDEAQARALLEEVARRAASPSLARTAWVKLEGLGQAPQTREAVLGFFGTQPDGVKLYRLRDALETTVTAYLMGRRLAQLGAPGQALPLLLRVLNDDAAPPAVTREARRLAVEAAHGAGECGEVERLVLEAPALEQARLEDWAARCDFEEAR